MDIRHPSKWCAFALLAFALLSLCGEPIRGQEVPARPNVVLFVLDDVRTSDMRYMPQTRGVFSEGRTFSRYFVSTPTCCPSRATMLTGSYAHNTGVYTNVYPEGGYQKFVELGNEDDTVAVALDKAGYETGLFGKYLNQYGAEGVPPGWDRWYASTGAERMNDQGVVVPREPGHYDDVISEKARSFVGGAQDPFFAYVAFDAAHERPAYAERHEDRYEDVVAKRTPAFNEADVSDKPAAVRKWPRLNKHDKAEVDAWERDRARALLAADEAIANTVGLLKEQGEFSNTYFFLVSDNGFHLGEHRLPRGKSMPYETDVRVPLLVRGPGVRAGVEKAMALNTDLAPTFAQVAGTTIPGVDGRSLVPLMRGKSPVWRSAVLLQKRPMIKGNNYKWQAVRTKEWTYVRWANGEKELYDLRRDPHQLESLHLSKAHRRFVKGLEVRLRALAACSGGGCEAAENP